MTKARGKPSNHLWRQRNFRNKNQGLFTLVQNRFDRLHVDFGLTGTRDSKDDMLLKSSACTNGVNRRLLLRIEGWRLVTLRERLVDPWSPAGLYRVLIG